MVGDTDAKDAVKKTQGASPLGYGGAADDGPCEQGPLANRHLAQGTRDNFIDV